MNIVQDDNSVIEKLEYGSLEEVFVDKNQDENYPQATFAQCTNLIVLLLTTFALLVIILISTKANQVLTNTDLINTSR